MIEATPSNPFSCAGMTAVITGAATGIGFASARALVVAGARVVLVGLGDVAAAAESLRADGGDAVAEPCDVTDLSGIERLLDAVWLRDGRLDVVVANAGVALDAPDASNALERLDRMYAVNVRAIAGLADRAMPLLAQSGGGSFIVMSSIAGLRGNIELSGYGVTKAANASLARSLAVRWGPHAVRSNSISPGVIDTEFARPTTEHPDRAKARRARTPLGRFGRPEEVAGAVVWLASPAGGFVNGQNIVIDRGTLIAD